MYTELTPIVQGKRNGREEKMKVKTSDHQTNFGSYDTYKARHVTKVQVLEKVLLHFTKKRLLSHSN